MALLSWQAVVAKRFHPPIVRKEKLNGFYREQSGVR